MLNLKKISFLLITFSISILSKASSLKDTATSETHVSAATMMAKLPGKKGEWFSLAMKQGETEVVIYSPKSKDLQTPHLRDEFYFIISGSGLFFNGTTKQKFKTGDVIFVPAKTEHRFEDFTDDFATWVIFVGPTFKKN